MLSSLVYFFSLEYPYFFMMDDSSRSMLWKTIREKKHETELA